MLSKSFHLVKQVIYFNVEKFILSFGFIYEVLHKVLHLWHYFLWNTLGIALQLKCEFINSQGLYDNHAKCVHKKGKVAERIMKCHTSQSMKLKSGNRLVDNWAINITNHIKVKYHGSWDYLWDSSYDGHV